MQTAFFADSDYYAQQAALWDYAFDMLLKLAADIRAGIFAADEQAMSEAEGLLEETQSFYDSLLTG